jgi:hypothetical protein
MYLGNCFQFSCGPEDGGGRGVVLRLSPRCNKRKKQYKLGCFWCVAGLRMFSVYPWTLLGSRVVIWENVEKSHFLAPGVVLGWSGGQDRGFHPKNRKSHF